MFLDKGFAYLHLPETQLYIGDIICILCVLYILLFIRPIVRWRLNDAAPIVTMLSYAFLRLLPDLPRYGFLSLRDSAILLYAYTAFFAYFFLRDHHDLLRWIRIMGWVLLIHTILTPVYLTVGLYRALHPTYLITHVPLFLMKPTDHTNFAALAVTFFLVAPVSIFKFRPEARLLLLLANLLYVAFTLIRGAYLAVAVVLILLIKGGYGRRLLVPSLICLILGAGITFFDLEANIGGKTLSVTVLVEEVQSIFLDRTYSHASVGTNHWRLEFWQSIFKENSRDFFTFCFGVGNGPNLAVDLGFVYPRQGSITTLRSAHSVILMVFGRFGLLGLLLWAWVQLHYFRNVISALRMVQGNERTAYALGLWISLGYVTVTLVNASFDVMLESPQTAIWYWFMVGAGLAISRMVRNQGVPVYTLPS